MYVRSAKPTVLRCRNSPILSRILLDFCQTLQLSSEEMHSASSALRARLSVAAKRASFLLYFGFSQCAVILDYNDKTVTLNFLNFLKQNKCEKSDCLHVFSVLRKGDKAKGWAMFGTRSRSINYVIRMMLTTYHMIYKTVLACICKEGVSNLQRPMHVL